jgi:hypothetical protein
MVDAADRAERRFPASEVARVTGEIRRTLRSWHVGPGTVVVCGAARGADIIAAEEALDLGAQVTVCLALPVDEFEATSVALPGSDWADRFRTLLTSAVVKVLPPLDDGAGDGTVFERANQWMLTESTALAGGRPHAVIVWNGRGGDGRGGTADFVRRLGYTKPADSIVVIDPTPRRYQSRQHAEGPKKLLALDGGGIRGILSLEILAALEAGLRARHHQPRSFVLADYFDYIGGTSTGAVIAAGLATGMTVAALAEAYLKLGETSFTRRTLPLHSLYQDRPLAGHLQTVFGERTLGDADLASLLLMVMHNTVTDSAWPLSNCTQAKYNRADRYLLATSDRNLDLRLAQLLRASTAAPVYFRPQTIDVGDHPFVFQDGGITPFNNPALLMFIMATLPEYGLQWPVGEDNLLIVSVGTGAAPAAHDGLSSRKVGYLFNAKNLTSVFMNGASVGQDLLCRALGKCRYGEPIDREFGARINITGSTETNLFTYLRYNADLSDTALSERGIDSSRDRQRLRKLDAVKAIPQLRAIGRDIGAKIDIDKHFQGFL